MGWSDWLRPPRHLLALFAAVTLVPAVALTWLGWQLVEKDQGFEQHQAQERLEGAADRTASVLASNLDAIARSLPAWSADPPSSLSPGAMLVTFGPRGLDRHGGVPLVFAPISSEERPEPAAATWSPGEALEFRGDFAGAARVFRELSSASDPDVRAGALVRLAGNLRKLRQADAALAAYRSLAELTGARVVAEPADLVARSAECRLLADFGRQDALGSAASALARDLSNGRWAIDRATYEMRTRELAAWTALADDREAVALAGGVESLYIERLTLGATVPDSGRTSLWKNGRAVLVIWHTEGPRQFILAATRTYLDRAWRELLSTERANVTLVDTEGRHVAGEAIPREARIAVREKADTGLPWTLRVSSAESPAAVAAVASRRRFIIAGLAVLIFLIPAGGFVVARAVQKELAVARLQADFVSAVSHEFRTPLTAMAHLTERLQRDPSIADDRRRQYYDALARDTDRLRRFVDTLLDFGRMEAGRARVDLRADDLPAVVSAVVDEFRADTAAGRHPVDFSSNGALPPVRLDRESFGRALWNLLDNAAKYSADDAPIRVDVGQDGGHAVVRVCDQGRGVAPADRRRIFKKFVRGEESHASGIRGTGVGLAMVDEIARAHGGEVRLESELGRGSTFSLVVPLT